jgi:outer membrane protein OmpA-like peptidoglycan-associated protein
VEVEASSEGIDGAYQHLGTIEAGVDSEATLEVMGVKARWLRFTVTANHGHSDWVYLREVMAHGELEPLPENDNRFTGRFDTNLGTLQLQQEAGILTGCYEGGVVLGAVKGGVARINWYDTASEGIGGVALFAMDSRGNLHGVRYSMPESSLWGGPPYGGESQICPPSRPNPVQQALQSNGNVILYGIGFAAEKDTVVPEAEGTMKLLLDALRADPALSVDIQVSTDDEGGKAHNQDLAQRRAASIAVWLTNNGIDASRMNPVGLGEMKPIAENGTSAGRALNRRVEIIRH